MNPTPVPRSRVDIRIAVPALAAAALQLDEETIWPNDRVTITARRTNFGTTYQFRTRDLGMLNQLQEEATDRSASGSEGFDETASTRAACRLVAQRCQRVERSLFEVEAEATATAR